MIEERVVTVGLRDMVGAERLRVRYLEESVEVSFVDKDVTFSFARHVWLEAVVEGAISAWGRTLHPQAPADDIIVGAVKPVEGVPDCPDGCENCGRGFGHSGDMMHLEQGVGVCLLAKAPVLWRA